MPAEQTLQDRLMQLEELLSHQEHRLAQLDEVVRKLHTSFDAVEAKLKERIEKVEHRLDDQQSDFDMNEKPPHY